MVVLGYTGCCAVTAAIDTHLNPRTYPRAPALRSVVDRILPAVRASESALSAQYGNEGATTDAGREGLIETSVVLNATLAAMTLRDDLESMAVRFGVFDLAGEIVERPYVRELLGPA